MDLVIIAKKNLADFKRIADEEGMRFMLMEGNLLGAYRDGGFCEGDENDIDLGIMDDEFYKFSDVSEELGKIGFECKKYVYTDIWHGGCWERNGNHIDIMRMLKDHDLVYNIGEGGALRYDYSADIFYKYGKINFLGLEIDTVGDIDKFLTERYGNWRVKVSRDEYSYKDPKYSPNIKKI
jgi:phosphorylcholine metabolism protein LicD